MRKGSSADGTRYRKCWQLCMCLPVGRLIVVICGSDLDRSPKDLLRDRHGLLREKQVLVQQPLGRLHLAVSMEAQLRGVLWFCLDQVFG